MHIYLLFSLQQKIAFAIGHIVILRDLDEEREKMLDAPERGLGILVDRFNKSFLAAVRQIEGVSDVS